MLLNELMNDMPVVAILRGVKPEEVVDVGAAIIEAGVRIIEVPLNSPEPFESIHNLSSAFPDIVTGAGTVVMPNDVKKVQSAGGSIIVSPNTDPAVISRSVVLGLTPMPGFQSVTEAFQAVKAGAKILKLFPAGSMGPSYIKAIKAVLPNDIRILAVGGAGAANINEWHAAGADGYGIGSEIYKAGMSAKEAGDNAGQIVAAYRAATSK